MLIILLYVRAESPHLTLTANGVWAVTGHFDIGNVLPERIE